MTDKQEKKVEVKKFEAPKNQNIPLSEVETVRLESLAFKIGEQIKGLQRQYNEVYNELVRREQEQSKGEQ